MKLVNHRMLNAWGFNQPRYCPAIGDTRSLLNPRQSLSTHSTWVICTRLAMLTVSLLLSGCDGLSPRDRVTREVENPTQVYPVSGRILVDGGPIAELIVRLIPASAKEADASHPKAFTDAGGEFAFSTYLQGDGVPPDSYRLVVERLTRQGPTMWVGPDKLNNLYNHLNEPAATITVDKNRPQTGLVISLKVEGRTPKPAPAGSAITIGRPVAN